VASTEHKPIGQQKSFMKMRIAAAIAHITGLQHVVGWWDNGHMLTAEIARQQLSDAQVAAINGILHDWNDDFPGASDVVTVAVWPDLLKCSTVSPFCRKPNPDDIGTFDAWHFDDKPYNPDHLKLPASASMWAGQPSASWLLTEAMGTAGGTTTRFALNFMMRFVVHIVGDMHQPLHATTGYFRDSQFGNLPNGDRGGNLIHVSSDCGADNLHAFWDAGGCLYLRNWPLSDSDQKALVINASVLIAEHPKDSFGNRYHADDLAQCWSYARARNRNASKTCSAVFERWVNESWNLAVTDAYVGVMPGKHISPEYKSRAQEIVKKELVLGGYRLADILKHFAAQSETMPPPSDHHVVEQWTDTANSLLGVSIALGVAALAEGLVLALCLRKRATARRGDNTELSEPQLLVRPQA